MSNLTPSPQGEGFAELLCYPVGTTSGRPQTKLIFV